MTWKALGDYRGPSTVRAFFRYAEQARREARERSAYMVYVTESLRLRAENKYITSTLAEVIGGGRRPEIDAEAVKASVIERGGLEVKP